MSTALSEIGQIAVVVSDVAKATTFYRDVLGLKFLFGAGPNLAFLAAGSVRIMLTTPQGKLSRYFYGVEYAPRDLRLGLIESSANKIGSPVDQLLLYCYHYDPATGKYGAAVMKVMRIAGVLTVLAIVAMLFLPKGRNPKLMGVKTGGAA